jgi:hypothetical protein
MEQEEEKDRVDCPHHEIYTKIERGSRNTMRILEGSSPMALSSFQQMEPQCGTLGPCGACTKTVSAHFCIQDVLVDAVHYAKSCASFSSNVE